MNQVPLRIVDELTARRRVGRPVGRRFRILLALTAVGLVLLLERGAMTCGLAEQPLSHANDHTGQARKTDRVACDPFHGPIRAESRNVLRSGRCRHGFLAVPGWDDPNDDETSDDPTDDDDCWEGLNAYGETDLSVSAWFVETGCCTCELESSAEPSGYRSCVLSSHIHLDRLRC